MSTMRDADLPILERIELATQRFIRGDRSMRVPVEATDADIALSDAAAEIRRLRADLAEAVALLESAQDVMAMNGSPAVSAFLAKHNKA